MLLASSSKIFSSKKKSKTYVRFDPLKDTDETFVNIFKSSRKMYKGEYSIFEGFRKWLSHCKKNSVQK